MKFSGNLFLLCLLAGALNLSAQTITLIPATWYQDNTINSNKFDASTRALIGTVTATNAVTGIKTNGTAISGQITNINFIGSGGTTVTGNVASGVANIGINSSASSQTNDTTKVAKAGDTMTGGLTNNSTQGFVGNGQNLTNLPTLITNFVGVGNILSGTLSNWFGHIMLSSPFVSNNTFNGSSIESVTCSVDMSGRATNNLVTFDQNATLEIIVPNATSTYFDTNHIKFSTEGAQIKIRLTSSDTVRSNLFHADDKNAVIDLTTDGAVLRNSITVGREALLRGNFATVSDNTITLGEDSEMSCDLTSYTGNTLTLGANSKLVGYVGSGFDATIIVPDGVTRIFANTTWADFTNGIVDAIGGFKSNGVWIASGGGSGFAGSYGGTATFGGVVSTNPLVAHTLLDVGIRYESTNKTITIESDMSDCDAVDRSYLQQEYKYYSSTNTWIAADGDTSYMRWNGSLWVFWDATAAEQIATATGSISVPPTNNWDLACIDPLAYSFSETVDRTNDWMTVTTTNIQTYNSTGVVLRKGATGGTAAHTAALKTATGIQSGGGARINLSNPDATDNAMDMAFEDGVWQSGSYSAATHSFGLSFSIPMQYDKGVSRQVILIGDHNDASDNAIGMGWWFANSQRMTGDGDGGMFNWLSGYSGTTNNVGTNDGSYTFNGMKTGWPVMGISENADNGTTRWLVLSSRSVGSWATTPTYTSWDGTAGNVISTKYKAIEYYYRTNQTESLNFFGRTNCLVAAITNDILTVPAGFSRTISNGVAPTTISATSGWTNTWGIDVQVFIAATAQAVSLNGTSLGTMTGVLAIHAQSGDKITGTSLTIKVKPE